jgi:hypothetical protein
VLAFNDVVEKAFPNALCIMTDLLNELSENTHRHWNKLLLMKPADGIFNVWVTITLEGLEVSCKNRVL